MLEKKYSPAGKSCKVTFALPVEDYMKSVAVLGEFNNWDPNEDIMKLKKSGVYELTKSLKAGNSYRFRYLVNGEVWLNDSSADYFVENDFGSEDSVVNV